MLKAWQAEPRERQDPGFLIDLLDLDEVDANAHYHLINLPNG